MLLKKITLFYIKDRNIYKKWMYKWKPRNPKQPHQSAYGFPGMLKNYERLKEGIKFVFA